MHRLRLIIATWAVLGGAGLARADEPPPLTGDAPGAPPPPAATQQLAIPKGGLVVNAFLDIDLSSGAVGKPISLSPDIWYGVTDDLTVGLVHSTDGTTGFISGPGTSLCLTGSTGGCANFYQNVGADVRYRMKPPITLDGGLYFLEFSPSVVFGAKLGAAFRWRFGKIALEVQPNLFIVIAGRSDGTPQMGVTPATPGFNELLFIPATVSYDVTDKIDVAGQTGLRIGSFSDVGDFYSVPLSIAGRYHVTPKISVGLAFTFLELIAKNGGADFRTVTIGASYAR